MLQREQSQRWFEIQQTHQIRLSGGKNSRVPRRLLCSEAGGVLGADRCLSNIHVNTAVQAVPQPCLRGDSACGTLNPPEGGAPARAWAGPGAGSGPAPRPLALLTPGVSAGAMFKTWLLGGIFSFGFWVLNRVWGFVCLFVCLALPERMGEM